MTYAQCILAILIALNAVPSIAAKSDQPIAKPRALFLASARVG
jgi:hypothetical protein